MKRFHFTLEAVRTLRQRQEQKALEQYAQALLARQQALARLGAAQHELDAAFEELRGHLAKGCAASQAAQAHEHQRALVGRRDELAAALGTAERRVNAAQQSMLAARQQREVVDKCFERQKSRHGRDMARADQKNLDELAGRRLNSILSWNPTELPP